MDDDQSKAIEMYRQSLQPKGMTIDEGLGISNGEGLQRQPGVSMDPNDYDAVTRQTQVPASNSSPYDDRVVDQPLGTIYNKADADPGYIRGDDVGIAKQNRDDNIRRQFGEMRSMENAGSPTAAKIHTLMGLAAAGKATPKQQLLLYNLMAGQDV